MPANVTMNEVTCSCMTCPLKNCPHQSESSVVIVAATSTGKLPNIMSVFLRSSHQAVELVLLNLSHNLAQHGESVIIIIRVSVNNFRSR